MIQYDADQFAFDENSMIQELCLQQESSQKDESSSGVKNVSNSYDQMANEIENELE